MALGRVPFCRGGLADPELDLHRADGGGDGVGFRGAAELEDGRAGGRLGERFEDELQASTLALSATDHQTDGTTRPDGITG